MSNLPLTSIGNNSSNQGGDNKLPPVGDPVSGAGGISDDHLQNNIHVSSTSVDNDKNNTKLPTINIEQEQQTNNINAITSSSSTSTSLSPPIILRTNSSTNTTVGA